MEEKGGWDVRGFADDIFKPKTVTSS